MRIAIYWVDFLHYHAARINAACQVGEQLGHDVFPIAVRPGSPEFPVPGYQNLLNSSIRILADSPSAGSMQSCRSARQMLRVLDEVDPDVVAIPGYDTRVALASLGWCRRRRRGAVLMTESQKHDYSRNLLKEWLKRGLIKAFDAAHVGGKPHATYLAELGMPPERIFTGYDVVDNGFWSSWSEHVRKDPNSWREQLGLPEHFFLTACRLVPKKNVAGLLRAYASYASQQANPWPLLIVGDGPLRIQLEQLAQNLGVCQQVRFLGYLSVKDMGPVYSLASVFILASGYAEQWGLVVNEAMAVGLPVIVSRICGCVPDLVEPGITGYHFDPRMLEQLTQLLLKFGNGQVDLQKMGIEARAKINYFSPEYFAQNLFKASEIALVHAKSRLL